MLGGMKRQLVPGRWQVAVEGLIGFVDDMVHASIGPEGKKYLPWVFTAFIFLLFANLMGNMPFGDRPGAHPFTVTSQFTFTGVMSLISFAIVLGVGFWKHGLHFFSLFVPHGRPLDRQVLLFPIEFISFMVRPFSLGLRPFIAMFAGPHPARHFRQFHRPGPECAAAAAMRLRCLGFLFVAFVNIARAAGRGNPGLRLRHPHRAVHQRRGQPSLTLSFTQGVQIMDLASAKVIGAGLAAIGVGVASAGVGYVFGSFLQGALRNPAAADGQQGRLFIGFAAAELLGLMAFAVAMIILYAM